MELYDIYAFCISVPLYIIAGLYSLLSAINIFLYFIKKDNGFFLDDIINSESLKVRTVCLSAVSLVMSLILLFSNNQFIIMLGCDDLRAMPDGIYCYYVLVTNEDNETYKLPGKITKAEQKYSTEDYVRKVQAYNVENVYFENGECLCFTGGDYFDYNDTEYEFDQYGNSWRINLTNRKAYHSEIAESKPLNLKILILSFVSVAVIVMNTIFYIYRLTKVSSDTI